MSKMEQKLQTEGKEAIAYSILISLSQLVETTFSFKLALQNLQNLEMICRWWEYR